jgi:hypothetical protein
MTEKGVNTPRMEKDLYYMALVDVLVAIKGENSSYIIQDKIQEMIDARRRLLTGK